MELSALTSKSFLTHNEDNSDLGTSSLGEGVSATPEWGVGLVDQLGWVSYEHGHEASVVTLKPSSFAGEVGNFVYILLFL